MEGDPAAFMSYVRFNDVHDDGQLTEFRKRLAAEVRAQTGHEFTIFQDRSDIAWGQNWQHRIDETLSTATLLLMIITPSLFRSKPCRAEFQKFLEREHDLDRQDLILPVYYISAREMEDPTLRKADEMATRLASRQFADWRELRFEPFTTTPVRKAIAQLASRLGDAFWQPYPIAADSDRLRPNPSLRSDAPDQGGVVYRAATESAGIRLLKTGKTSKVIRVNAQWALEGKLPDDADCHVLSCSTGDLDHAEFEEAISKFRIGALDTPPQVSVSYTRQGKEPGTSYLTVAIHWYATEGQSYADWVPPRDSQGRLIAYTSYFCLPYRVLADNAIGYQPLYEALRSVTLTTADGPSIAVPIAKPTSRTVAFDGIAVGVAPLLLTGVPVCVLGAEGTSVLERLRFIDSVMELLPYGYRSRMTAATWTKASSHNHQFRLFFSSAPPADEASYVMKWGNDPHLANIAAGDAGEYFDWLQESVGPLARLAELTSEMGFDQNDTTKALESVFGTRRQYGSRSAACVSNGRTGQPPVAPARVDDEGEQLLSDCLADAKLQNGTRLRADIGLLKKFTEGGIDMKRRKRYLNLITKLGLLQHSFLLAEPGHLRPGHFSKENKYTTLLYDALLQMAVGAPLSYAAYFWAEKCAGIVHGDVPHQELLAAIGRAGTTDPVVNAIVHWHQREPDEKKYYGWLLSGEIDPIDLIKRLAGNKIHPKHGRFVSDLTLDYLRKAASKYDLRQIRRELCKHGFLARALQVRYPDNDYYQVHALYEFLRVVYPRPADTPGQDLSSTAILEILDGTGPPPTPALLGAVLMLVDSREACQLAWNAYIDGSLTRSVFGTKVFERLQTRLPHFERQKVSDRTLT